MKRPLSRILAVCLVTLVVLGLASLRVERSPVGSAFASGGGDGDGGGSGKRRRLRQSGR